MTSAGADSPALKAKPHIVLDYTEPCETLAAQIEESLRQEFFKAASEKNGVPLQVGNYRISFSPHALWDGYKVTKAKITGDKNFKLTREFDSSRGKEGLLSWLCTRVAIDSVQPEAEAEKLRLEQQNPGVVVEINDLRTDCPYFEITPSD